MTCWKKSCHKKACVLYRRRFVLTVMPQKGAKCIAHRRAKPHICTKYVAVRKRRGSGKAAGAHASANMKRAWAHARASGRPKGPLRKEDFERSIHRARKVRVRHCIAVNRKTRRCQKFMAGP